MKLNPSAAGVSPGRTLYLDNLRVYLTILVVFHHAAVTYGAPGSWYYSEPVDGLVSGLLLTMFVSTNQAFFMGLFFFLSAYFVLPSLTRKGVGRFMVDRLKRLGIPLVVYAFVLSPATIAVSLWARQESAGYWDIAGTEVGVLWFTAALLLFTAVYAALYAGGAVKERSVALPGDGAVLLLGVAMGLVSFVVRLVYPIGTTVLLGFQPAHFTQYIVLFTLGVVAYRNGWIESITPERGRKWRRIALVLIFIGLPCVYALKVITHAEIDSFLGGLTIQAFANALWEQVLGVSMIMALLGIGKAWSTQGNVLTGMSRGAYAVYILHPLVLVIVSVFLGAVALPSLVKLVLAGSVATAVSFGLAAVLVRTPLVRNVV